MAGDAVAVAQHGPVLLEHAGKPPAADAVEQEPDTEALHDVGAGPAGLAGKHKGQPERPVVDAQHEAGDVAAGDAVERQQAAAAPADPHEAGKAGGVAHGGAPEPAGAPDAPALDNGAAEQEAHEEKEGGDAARAVGDVAGEEAVEGQAVEGEVVEPREPGAGEKKQALDAARAGGAEGVLADTLPHEAHGEAQRDEAPDVEGEKAPGAVAAAVAVVEEVHDDGRVAAEHDGGVEHGDGREVEDAGVVGEEGGGRSEHEAGDNAHQPQVVSVAHGAHSGADGEARREGGVEQQGGAAVVGARRLGSVVGEVVVEMQGDDAAKELADGALLVRSDAGEAVAAVDGAAVVRGSRRLHDVRLVLHPPVRVLDHVVGQAGAAAERRTPHVERLVPPERAHAAAGVQATLVVCPEPQLRRRPAGERHGRRPVHGRRPEEQVSVEQPQRHQQAGEVHGQHGQPRAPPSPLPERQRHPVHQVHPRAVAVPEVLDPVRGPGRTPPDLQQPPPDDAARSVPFALVAIAVAIAIVTVTVTVALPGSFVVVVPSADSVAARVALPAPNTVCRQLDVVPLPLTVFSVLAFGAMHPFPRSHDTFHTICSVSAVSTIAVVAPETP